MSGFLVPGFGRFLVVPGQDAWARGMAAYVRNGRSAFTSQIMSLRLGPVRCLLLDLDPYGGTDPLGMFPLFLKRTADVIAPVLV